MVAFALAITWWLTLVSAPARIGMRVPGSDRTPEQAATAPASVDLRGSFAAGREAPSHPTAPKGMWPTFRGPNASAVADDEKLDPAKLPEAAKSPLWKIDLGDGYAGPAIRDGRVYLLDYDIATRADVLRCLALDDGVEIWRRAYPVDVKRNHGMSRTVPAVSESYVVSLGPKCHVLCLDAHSGDYIWGLDLVRHYRTKVPPWYAGQCPIIDKERAIIAPGGSALMIAVDCASGRVMWETPNPRGWDMTHSSIIPMEFGGVRMFVYCGSGGVAGVDAETGKLLWESTAWRVKIATVPSPIPLGDDRILLTGGYDAGAMMLRLVPSAGGFNVETLWTAEAKVLGSEQQTPICFDGMIYAVIPGGQLACIDPKTGKQVWNSGKSRFGIGPYAIANRVIWLMNDTGTLSCVAADPVQFKLLSSAEVLPKGHEAWGPMAIAGGRMLVRDITRMVCLDLSETGHE